MAVSSGGGGLRRRQPSFGERIGSFGEALGDFLGFGSETAPGLTTLEGDPVQINSNVVPFAGPIRAGAGAVGRGLSGLDDAFFAAGRKLDGTRLGQFALRHQRGIRNAGGVGAALGGAAGISRLGGQQGPTATVGDFQDTGQMGQFYGFSELQQPTPPNFDAIANAGGSSSSSHGGGFDVNAGFAELEAAQAQAIDALDNLEGQFNARKEMLREEYQLSETPEERAALQFQLDQIETMREAGTKVIQRVYTDAIQSAHKRAGEVRDRGQEQAAATRETFTGAQQRSTQAMADINQEFSGAMGVAGEDLSPLAEARVAQTAERGEIEAALDRRLADLTADDIAFLGEAMGPESAAQVAALQRDATQASAGAMTAHQAQVNNRIAQERSNWQQALFGLSNTFDQRRFGLEDTLIGLQGQASQLAASNQATAASLAQQASAQANQLSPAQEFALAQEQARYERELAEFERQNYIRRTTSGLVNSGVPIRDATLAARMGLGEQLAQDLLGIGLSPQDRMLLQQGGVQP